MFDGIPDDVLFLVLEYIWLDILNYKRTGFIFVNKFTFEITKRFFESYCKSYQMCEIAYLNGVSGDALSVLFMKLRIPLQCRLTLLRKLGHRDKNQFYEYLEIVEPKFVVPFMNSEEAMKELSITILRALHEDRDTVRIDIKLFSRVYTNIYDIYEKRFLTIFIRYIILFLMFQINNHEKLENGFRMICRCIEKLLGTQERYVDLPKIFETISKVYF